VNINESNQIVEALRKRGIDVQYIVKENEGTASRTRRTASSSTRRWRPSSRAT
jgi:hypothetical protein